MNWRLQSTFIEIMNPKKSKIPVGTIYKHPSIDLTDFNSNNLYNLLEKISKNKNLFSFKVILTLIY